MGPIGVAAHLVPYVPAHPAQPSTSDKAIHAVAAAPWGSSGILVISHASIRMLGADGLTTATRYAILNANYLNAVLQDYFPILFSGNNGPVAHALILS